MVLPRGNLGTNGGTLARAQAGGYLLCPLLMTLRISPIARRPPRDKAQLPLGCFGGIDAAERHHVPPRRSAAANHSRANIDIVQLDAHTSRYTAACT